MRALEIAGMIELLLVAIEPLGLFKDGLLPLGGGHIQQVGVIFALTAVIAEICVLCHG